tara:strand:- start:1842 stop:2414 length:573 start_codon:yes stop_codon:yes gene_type:complete
MIFIYCGGKCGGSTLRETLKSIDTVNHLHNKRDYKFLHNNMSLDILDEITKHSKEKPTYVIDAYRERNSRKISSFFQNINYHIGGDWKKFSLVQLMNEFKKIYDDLENYEAIDEVFNHFNIPLLTPNDEPYTVVKQGNLILVKLKFSHIEDWGTHLTEIFQQPITIVKDNLTKDKEIYPLYCLFKSVFKN